MTGITRTIRIKTGALLLAAVAACSIGTSSARAGDFRIGIDLGRERRFEPECREDVDRVWVEPVYRTVCDRVWVEGSTTIVNERVWVPPVTQTVCDRVWIPDRVEERQIVHGNGPRRWVECIRVVIEPGHYAERRRQVELTPGHWENVPREVRTEAHWQNVERQELVAPGHWEWQREARPEPTRHHDWFRIEVGGR